VVGLALEWTALRGIDQWLSKLGPRPNLLRTALSDLQHHEKQSPDQLDSIKADYYLKRHDPASFFGIVMLDSSREAVKPERLLLQKLAESPWERERQLRFLRAYYQAQLRAAKLPL